MSRPAVHKQRGRHYWGRVEIWCASSNSVTVPRTVHLWKDVTCGHRLRLRPATDG